MMSFLRKSFGFRVKSGDNPSKKNNDIIEATNKGQYEDVKNLIQLGVDVNLRDKFGLTALHCAVIGQHEHIVRILIDSGADVNLINDNGHTPLCLADDEEIAKLLAPKTSNIRSALSTALSMGYTHIVRILLQFELDINCRIGKDESTPTIIAASLNRVEVVKFLIENDADINIPNNAGNTPLILATNQGFSRLSYLLINNHADVNAINNSGGTALHEAVDNGDVDLVNLLLEKGADPNAKDIYGHTPLHDAVSEGHSEIVKILIGSGTSLDVISSIGDKVVDLAVKTDSQDIIDLISNKLDKAQ